MVRRFKNERRTFSLGEPVWSHVGSFCVVPKSQGQGNGKHQLKECFTVRRPSCGTRLCTMDPRICFLTVWSPAEAFLPVLHLPHRQAGSGTAMAHSEAPWEELPCSSHEKSSGEFHPDALSHLPFVFESRVSL